ncbi:MAG: hypothetical protein GXO45_05915 [Aquificae bacterium]|nr:hypothetical protein [Aquificota bacterium]
MEFKNTVEKGECFKCGKKDTKVMEDPNIEGLFFCVDCWEERIKTEQIEKWGFDEEIPYE